MNQLERQKKSLIEDWLKSGILRDKEILIAFEKTHREKFMPEEFTKFAYFDSPIPIGQKQTMSQPTTVVIMTQELEPKKGHKILEVGSGSAYQAVILSRIVGREGKIISTEINKKLAIYAKENIQRTGLKNIEIKYHDGSKGYEKEAPYDRIIVSAASPLIPKPLIKQLKEKGIIIIPIGNKDSQKMIKARKIKGKLKEECLGIFRFVPLRGEYGFKSS